MNPPADYQVEVVADIIVIFDVVLTRCWGTPQLDNAEITENTER